MPKARSSMFTTARTSSDGIGKISGLCLALKISAQRGRSAWVEIISFPPIFLPREFLKRCIAVFSRPDFSEQREHRDKILTVGSVSLYRKQRRDPLADTETYHTNTLKLYKKSHKLSIEYTPNHSCLLSDHIIVRQRGGAPRYYDAVTFLLMRLYTGFIVRPWTTVVKNTTA